MKIVSICSAIVVFLAMSTGTVSAQDDAKYGKYHPLLSDNFQLGVGAYRPRKERKLGVDTGAPDLSGSLNSDEDQSTAILNFRWRFTKNWHFSTTYWKTDSFASQTLTEPYEFNGIVFQPGTAISSAIDTSIARLFWGRSFFRKPNHDWGVGLGLHWLSIDATLQGRVSVDDGMGGFINEGGISSAEVSAPLPNLGIWYMWSWSPKWALNTRFDWLDITVGDISGSMFDAAVGLNYQMSRHFGMGFGINAFKLDVDLKKDLLKSSFETTQYGPRLNLTWNW